MTANLNPILTVENLYKHFPDRYGSVRAVDGVSFSIKPGETLGLVGESGCGKSTVGRTILRFYKPTKGRIVLDGNDIAQLDERQLRPIRRDIQIVFQDPYGSLNPRARIGRILEEPLIVWGEGDARSRRDQTVALLEKVGLRADYMERFPHELSGGQRQRVGIARALALNPKVIVCDEAVSALDVSVRAQIINLLVDLQRSMGISYLFISHDLSVVEHVSDRVAVMYLGRIVEIASAAQLWSAPVHPYTRALFDASPRLFDTGETRKPLLQGDIPSPVHMPGGCRFHTRCPFATPVCRSEEPPVVAVAPGHAVACHHTEIFVAENRARLAKSRPLDPAGQSWSASHSLKKGDLT